MSDKTPAKATAVKAKGAAPAAAKTQAVTAADLGSVNATHVVVRSLVPGFRRAGRAWPVEETTVPMDEFSAEELDSLLAETNLLVGFVELPAGTDATSNGNQEGQQ